MFEIDPQKLILKTDLKRENILSSVITPETPNLGEFLKPDEIGIPVDPKDIEQRPDGMVTITIVRHPGPDRWAEKPHRYFATGGEIFLVFRLSNQKPKPTELPNFLKPVTRETITDEDIEFLNKLRLGLFPITELTPEKNINLACEMGKEIVRMYWHLLDLDQKRVWYQKLFNFGLQAKHLLTISIDEENKSLSAETRKKIKQGLEIRSAKLIGDAEREREKPRTRKRGPKLGEAEKLIKSLQKSRLSMDAIVEIMKDSFGELSEEQVREMASALLAPSPQTPAGSKNGK